MDQMNPQPLSEAAARPPMVPGRIPVDEPRWPKVIGVLAIVFGSYGVLEHACGAASPMFMGMMNTMLAQAVPPGQEDLMKAQNDAMVPFVIPLVVTNVLLLGSALLLVVGGIRLMGRQADARPMLLVYAGAELALTLGYLGLSWAMSEAIMTAVSESASAAGGVPPGMLGMIGMMSGVLGLVFGLAFYTPWPIFLIVWMLRRPIVEQVRAWRARRVANLPTM